MLLNAGIEPLPVLRLVVNKVVHSVSSIDLLLRLNKLPEFNKLQGMCNSNTINIYGCTQITIN